MKTTRHSLMAKGLAVLLSLLVLIFAFTYSWFSSADTPAEATGLSVTAASSVDFDIAVGFSNAQTEYEYISTDFAKTFSLRDILYNGVHYDVLNDFSPLDVTSDGVTFSRPELVGDTTASNGRKKPAPDESSYYAVEANKEYISFDLIFRCERECNVYIDSGSVVKARCEVEAGKTVENGGTVLSALNIGQSNLSNASLTSALLNTAGFSSAENPASAAYNKSSYGDFSKDAVVGAIRVSFVDYNSSLNLSNIFENTASLMKNAAEFIWLPRPDIYLQDTNNTDNDWVLYTVDVNDPSDTHKAITTVHTYWDYTNHTVATYSNTVTECNANTIVHLDIPQYSAENPSQVLYYYGKTRVNIWLEGTDAEARRAIAGGEFYINFDLRAG